MPTPARADAYLSIPPRFADALGGLRWSHGCDAIETAAGDTLALSEQIEPFLAGLFAAGRLPPFAYALTVLTLMKTGGPLRSAFSQTRGAAGRERNAGLLAAELLRDLPPEPDPPAWADIATALLRRKRDGERSRSELVFEPPLTRSAVEQGLRKLDDATLHHWMVHGCGLVSGSKLADETDALPARIAEVIRLARQHPRLAGVVLLASAVDAGLTLPPRRRTPDRLPQGGYSDVTTRGTPERLLPAQFALDADEFVRRFAENELLYFEREEPHKGRTPERVIVLDQGVRTWGGVRLGLAAAAVALLRKDAKRYGPATLVLTSGGRCDLLGVGVETAVEAVAASDLTAHPAEALALARAVGDGPRDIILLTHPRALAEPAVIAAATSRHDTDRLFALTLDADGRAELVEWATAGPRLVRTFRVDLAAAEAVKVSVPKPAGEAPPSWIGDIEPVPFPFHPGLVIEPRMLAFDAAGEWLAVLGPDGVVQAVPPDDRPPEVLPRAMRDGFVLKEVDAVLGVPGGVVVCGQMEVTRATLDSLDEVSTPPPRGSGPASVQAYAFAHYRWSDRTVQLVVAASATNPSADGSWSAYPDLNCVAYCGPVHRFGYDLDTHDRYTGMTLGVGRAVDAVGRATRGGGPPYRVPVLGQQVGSNFPYLRHTPAGMQLFGVSPPWLPFVPKEDGNLPPIHRWRSATYAAGVLAAIVFRNETSWLGLFRGPDGRTVREVPLSAETAPLALSIDGRMVAYRRTSKTIEIADTGDAGPPLRRVGHARLHANLTVRLSGGKSFRLVVRIGEFVHTFGVTPIDVLSHEFRHDPPGPPDTLVPCRPPLTAYDLDRFPDKLQDTAEKLYAGVDRLGQVVLSTTGGTLVALFVVRRTKAAAWEPGGAMWGDPALIGGSATPQADEHIGEAIRRAMG